MTALLIIGIIYCWLMYEVYTAPYMDEEIESDDDELF